MARTCARRRMLMAGIVCIRSAGSSSRRDGDSLLQNISPRILCRESWGKALGQASILLRRCHLPPQGQRFVKPSQPIREHLECMAVAQTDWAHERFRRRASCLGLSEPVRLQRQLMQERDRSRHVPTAWLERRAIWSPLSGLGDPAPETRPAPSAAPTLQQERLREYAYPGEACTRSTGLTRQVRCGLRPTPS